jgi:four helix bundle protein
VANTYRELMAWQKAFSLCLDAYRATRHFPKTEAHGLAAQMQRAAVSVPFNIAEGFGRRTTPDFLRSLHIAYGSICELRTQIMLAAELGYLQQDESDSLLQTAGDVERLTKAFIRSLEEKRFPAH